MNQVLESARYYANNKIKVFPFNVNSQPPNKSILAFGIASDSTENINAWFTNTDRNYGICTGNGLIVIDVDNKDGKDGNEIINRIVGKFPVTRKIGTPHNGYHYFFKVNREIESIDNLYEGIDLIAEDNFVVGEGSIVDDNPYFVLCNNDIAEANDEVYSFIENGRKLTLEERIQRMTDSINKVQFKKTWISAAELKKSPKTKNEAIIEGMLSPGVCLLAAPPKEGKSFFCMQLANSIAEGIDFFGKKTDRSHVYYLAFEDDNNEMRDRLNYVKYKSSDWCDLEFCEPYQIDFDLEEKIQHYMLFNPLCKVVVIDTYEKIRAENRDREYHMDYKEYSMIDALAKKYELSIIVVLHTRKSIDYANPFANIIGSFGASSAATCRMVLLPSRYDSTILEFYYDGKRFPGGKMLLRTNEFSLYEVVPEDDEDIMNPELDKIIKYVISKGEYFGPLEKLGVLAKIDNPKGKHIRTLLEKNIKVLKSFKITMKTVDRTSKARPVYLTYEGEEKSDK